MIHTGVRYCESTMFACKLHDKEKNKRFFGLIQHLTQRSIMKSLIILWMLLQSFMARIEGSEEELRLVVNLFSAYDTDVRPSDRPSDVTLVKLSVKLYQIMDLDARNQVLTCKVWIRQIWYDSYMRWNTSLYSGLDRVSVHPSRLWKPGLVLYNSVSDTSWHLDKYQADVTSEGIVTWAAPVIVHSSCAVNVRYFPWDQQMCTLKFGSWAYDSKTVDLINTNDSLVSQADYVVSGEWDFISFTVERQVKQFECCETSHTYLLFNLTIHRRPLYYVFNLLLPCVVVKGVGLLVFYLPPPSGEKVSLTVTILVALTFFLRLVAQTLPVQSDTIPILGEYIAATIMLISLSAAMTAYVLACYHRGRFGQEVPGWAKFIVIHCIGRLLCLNREVNPSHGNKISNFGMDAGSWHYVLPQSSEHKDYPAQMRQLEHMDDTRQQPNVLNSFEQSSTETLTQIFATLHSLQVSEQAQQVQRSHNQEWVRLVMVLDRLFLWLFALSGMVAGCAILLYRP